MKNQNSLKWIIKNSKGEIPKIVKDNEKNYR